MEVFQRGGGSAMEGERAKEGLEEKRVRLVGLELSCVWPREIVRLD